MKDYVNRVIEGDCLKILKDIPSKSIRMVLADLPYGTTANPWDKPIDLERLWQEYERVTVDNGVFALTSQGLFTASLIMSNPHIFKYKIVWIKSVATNYLNAKKQPLRRHEDICIFYRKQPVYNPQMSNGKAYTATRHSKPNNSYGIHASTTSRSNGLRYPNDVVCHEEDHLYSNTAVSEGRVYHPNQKPVSLGRYLIRTYSNEGDIILDNACGSGSFLVAAVLEKRRFIGIEKNEYASQFNEPVDYINICNERLKEASACNHVANALQLNFKQ